MNESAFSQIPLAFSVLAMFVIHPPHFTTEIGAKVVEFSDAFFLRLVSG
jgi:hypothetical protein